VNALSLLLALQLAQLDSTPSAPREHRGPGEVVWPSDGAPTVDEPVTSRRPPPPRLAETRERITVAIGLAPDAPGTALELDLLARLERSAKASKHPRTKVARIREGAPEPRRACREIKDDLVVVIGYLPGREDPVVLAHDCRLDAALGTRGAAAVDEPGLVAALWEEHRSLEQQGARERRRRAARLSTRAKAGIVAGVAVVVIAGAIALLVANALRDHKVVLKVSP
jgi:hypothetical protein